jgi:hypothetical protein
MTSALRWRIVTLQVVLIVVLAFTAGFLYWAATFTHSYIHDELVAQKIAFPVAGSAAITTLPAPDAQAMRQYAGQALDSGDKAQTYASHYIAVHLREIGGGKTYAQVSAASLAAPTNAKLAALTQTLFRGETLRGLLLNAWGWWTVGAYALWAAIGLTIAAIAVFLALLFEVLIAPNRGAAAVRGRATTVA